MLTTTAQPIAIAYDAEYATEPPSAAHSHAPSGLLRPHGGRVNGQESLILRRPAGASNDEAGSPTPDKCKEHRLAVELYRLRTQTFDKQT